MIYGQPITFGGGGAGLNIAYGTTPPTDTSKLWIPLTQKPDNVEVSGDSLQNAVDVVNLLSVTLNNETSRHSAVEINGKIYSFGTATEYVEVFDPATGTCTLTSAKPPSYTVEGSCAVAINGKAYIFGSGTNTASAYLRTLMYDPETDTFTQLAQLSYGAAYASAVAINGKAYIFGGTNHDNTYNTIREYDPETNTVSTKGARLSTARSYTSAVAINGKAYIFGCGATSTAIEEYDPAEDKITVKAATATGSNSSAAAINGKAYIFYRTSIIEYDPSADVCETKSTTLINDINGRQGCAVVGDTIYILGTGITTTYKKIQSYTPAAYLGANHLKLFASVYRAQSYQVPTNIVNDKAAQIKLYMTSAFLGDEDGYAKAQPAYVYDEANSEWQALDGTSMTTDMLAALAELGVT